MRPLVKQPFHVRTKEHFSYLPQTENKKELLEGYMRFIDLLPELASHLKEEIVQEENDIFQIRMHTDLRHLLTHKDTFVLHYGKKQLGEKIRRIVEEHRSRHNLTGLGHNRTGYHFSYPGQKKGLGHSETIARILARTFLQDERRDTMQIARALQEGAETLMSSSLDELHRRLLRVR